MPCSILCRLRCFVFYDGIVPEKLFIMIQTTSPVCTGRAPRRLHIEHSITAQTQRQDPNAGTIKDLTNLLGGRPVLNNEGGEVNSAFVDGSAASFSEFPVLPCCTFKKKNGVTTLLNLTDTQARGTFTSVAFALKLNMKNVPCLDMY